MTSSAWRARSGPPVSAFGSFALVGYPGLLQDNAIVVEQFKHIRSLANSRLARRTRMPACILGRAATPGGLPVYVLLCPKLYDRKGKPTMADEHGRDWPGQDIRFGRWARLRQSSPRHMDKKWAADRVTPKRRQSRARAGYLAWSGATVPLDPDYSNLAIRLFPRDRCAGRAAPESSPYRWIGVFYEPVDFLKGGSLRLALTTVRSTTRRRSHSRKLVAARRPAANPVRRGQFDGSSNGIDGKLGPRFCAQIGAAVRRGRLGSSAPMRFAEGQFGLPLVAGPIFVWSPGLRDQEGHRLVLSQDDEIIDAGRTDRRDRFRRTEDEQRWSMRIAAERMRSEGRRPSKTARREAFSPASASR